MVTKVTRFVRKWWWLILAVGGVALWVLWKIFQPRRPDAPAPALTKPPKLIEMARAEVERVHLEGEVEKAKVRAEAKAQVQQIEAIEEKGKTDPAAARKDLAAFLATNL